MYRNTPHGRPQWARPITPDVTPEHIMWKSFLGGAPQHELEPNRYVDWRFCWYHSGKYFLVQGPERQIPK